MANEITYSGLETNGGRVAEVLAALVHENLYDKSALRPYMTFFPSWMGSDTLAIPTATHGLAMSAASSETSGGASNSALSTGEVNLQIARYLAIRQMTDLFAITSPDGPIDVDYVVTKLAEALDLTLTDLLVSLFASVSGSSGTSGVDLTVDDFLDAKYQLNVNNNSEALVAVLHGVQVNDLEESIRGESGPAQYKADFQNAIGSQVGFGPKFTFAGVEVIQSDSVPLVNTNADRGGCMFSRSAFAYTLGDVPRILQQQMVDPADVFLQTPEMWIERVRDASNGMTSAIINAYPAVAEMEDLRAQRIVTDA